MSLRVIAGQARGMKLKAVPGNRTRPVMDRVKEALFSIIGSDVRGANFLDLYAGTGSVGIEALSRGADFALFVERDRGAVRVIRDNLSHTRLQARARVSRRDAFDLLAQEPDRQYNFLFVAPPQYRDMWRKTLTALDLNASWHSASSEVIAQIDPAEFDETQRWKSLQLKDKRVYGRTMLLFYDFVLRK